MKYCYANRRQAAYPDVFGTWTARPEHFVDGFLRSAAAAGYDGLEVGANTLDATGRGRGDVTRFGARLADAGLPIVAVRAGGSLIEAKSARANLAVLHRSVDYAEWLGVGVVTGNLMSPQRYLPAGWEPTGMTRSQDASRDQSIYLYERIAPDLQATCDRAAAFGATVSIELHHSSPVDTSWSALLLCELVDRPNFGINPDLGNLAWAFDLPEESPEDAMKALAGVAVYWHCKNVYRAHRPENERAIAWKVSLADGEMDYHFLMSAMIEAGYDGYVAIEGGRTGDQFEMDNRSLDYLKSLEAEITSTG